MARPIHKLHEDLVRSLEAPGLHSDGAGLYLSVGERGAKSWRYLYRRGTKRTELGLGAYPAVSLCEARRRAEDLNERRRRGEHPRSLARP
jgi:hypothetical protein